MQTGSTDGLTSPPAVRPAIDDVQVGAVCNIQAVGSSLSPQQTASTGGRRSVRIQPPPAVRPTIDNVQVGAIRISGYQGTNCRCLPTEQC